MSSDSYKAGIALFVCFAPWPQLKFSVSGCREGTFGGRVSGFEELGDREGQSRSKTSDLGEEAHPRRSQVERAEHEGFAFLSSDFDLGLVVPHSLEGTQCG